METNICSRTHSGDSRDAEDGSQHPRSPRRRGDVHAQFQHRHTDLHAAAATTTTATAATVAATAAIAAAAAKRRATGPQSVEYQVVRARRGKVSFVLMMI